MVKSTSTLAASSANILSKPAPASNVVIPVNVLFPAIDWSLVVNTTPFTLTSTWSVADTLVDIPVPPDIVNVFP